MKKKYLVSAILPAIALAVIGTGIASAHGWFGGFGGFATLDSEEIVQRAETMFQNKADLLGISIEEVKNAWAEGKTIREIAEEQGLTQEQLQEKIREEHQERIQNRLQLLTDNEVISQEQANRRLQTMEERFENRECPEGFGRRFGRGLGW